MNKTKVFGDGDNLFLFYKEGTHEIMYTLRRPYVTNIDVQIPNQYGAVGLLGGGELKIEPPQEPITFTMEFKVMPVLPNGESGYKVESSLEGGLMKGLDLFKNVTVSNLFRAINKKLSKRAEGKK